VHQHFQANLARELDKALKVEQVQQLAWRAITQNRDIVSRKGNLLKRSKVKIIRNAKGKLIKLSNSSKYAAAQDLGSGLYGPKRAKYLIQAKNGKALHFTSKTGKEVFVRRVWHPGVKPTHFLYNAANSVGRQIKPWLEVAMKNAASKF